MFKIMLGGWLNHVEAGTSPGSALLIIRMPHSAASWEGSFSQGHGDVAPKKWLAQQRVMAVMALWAYES